ncbi:MAG: cytochrome b/b6 domain-containing protein [Actinomycetota bacterium]
MIARFDRTERTVHWVNATLFFTVMFTGLALYAGPVSTMVGRRVLMKTIHVYAGIALPIPILLGIVLRSGAPLRADLRRLARWDVEDRGWWRRARRGRVRLGKFNPGQKLNATFVGATIVVMLATGAILRWPDPFANDVRTGATFVHDWFAIGVYLTVAGHILFALSDRESLRSITRGWVSEHWARTERPRWYESVAGEGGTGSAGAADPSGPVGDLVARAD